MTDSSLPGDISAMIEALETLDTTDPAADPVRFIVATDWSDGAAPFALLKAFRVMFSQEDHVQLVFAVPHEPTEEDAACVQVLLEGAGDSSDTRGLELVSFSAAVEAAYDTAVVPNGDEASLVTQVVGLATRMHDVARTLDARRRGDQGNPAGHNQGSPTALRTRFDGFLAAS